MAMLDYGVLIKKNRKRTNEFILGDDDLNIEIYKTIVIIKSNNKIIKKIYGIEDSNTSYKKYRYRFKINKVNFDIKRLGDSQFKLRFDYKGNKYICVYGYGVGNNVYDWWRHGLGMSKKEAESCLQWEKYL